MTASPSRSAVNARPSRRSRADGRQGLDGVLAGDEPPRHVGGRVPREPRQELRAGILGGQRRPPAASTRGRVARLGRGIPRSGRRTPSVVLNDGHRVDEPEELDLDRRSPTVRSISRSSHHALSRATARDPPARTARGRSASSAARGRRAGHIDPARRCRSPSGGPAGPHDCFPDRSGSILSRPAAG